MKIIIGIAFLGILVSLAAAGLFMLKSDDTQGKTNSMARALALRIGISVALFVLILILWSLGVIRPTGIIPN
jgi:hypothetical protein